MATKKILYILYIFLFCILAISIYLFPSKNFSYVNNSGPIVADESVGETKDTPVIASDILKNISKTVVSDRYEVKSDGANKTIHMIEDERYSKLSYDFDTYTPSQKLLDSGTKPAHVVPTNALNEKEVMGFMSYWQLSNYKNMQYDKLSTVAYFAMTCYDNGTWVKDTAYSGFFSTNFAKMRDLAHSKGTKVVVVVKNFDARSIKNLAANVGGAGDRLIENTVKLVKDYDLDGVNVDYEFVASAEYPVTSTLRANIAAWHDKLADRIHSEVPGAIVSTDVFGSSAVGTTAYDIAALGRTSLDYIMFMNYDYITTRCYAGKYMTPMSPLYGNYAYDAAGYNVATHLAEAAKKAPSRKILMGVPYYGIDFRVFTADREKYNARVDYVSGCDGAIETYRSITDPIYDQFHNSSTLRWNNSEKARWYVYNDGSYWRHGYYDDYSSLSAKYAYVRETNLGGIGIWALGYDSGRQELWNAIRDGFQKVPFVIGFDARLSTEQINSVLSANDLTVVSQIGDKSYKVRPNSELSSVVISRLKSDPMILVVGFEEVGTDSKVLF